MITTASGFKDSSGKFFDKREDALEAEREIQLRAALTVIIDDIYFHSIQPHEIVSGLMERVAAIKEALSQ